MRDTILFDLDGTLWDSVAGVVAAWQEVLARHPEAQARISEEIMRGYMGKTTQQIARLMMPSLSDEAALSIIGECDAQEQLYLRAHGGGRLYDGLFPTLSQLERKYDLYIVSNCGCGYIETFLDVHGAAPFFKGHLCAGETGLEKGENIGLILERAGWPRAFYVGDTDGDERAARQAGIAFVHAAYGFGKASAPDAVLHAFAGLPCVAAQLFS